MKLPCVAIRPHWITIIGFLQISIELVTLLITAVPTRSADGSAHDARVRLGESDGGPRARIGPVWLSRSKDRPPAWHIIVKDAVEPGSLLVGAAVGYMCQPEWLR